jgi:hypothetical protein
MPLRSVCRPRHTLCNVYERVLHIQLHTSRKLISAHSKSSAMQIAIDFTSVSLRHAVAHCKQATAQVLQASTHAFWASFIIFIFLKGLSEYSVPALWTIGAKASVCQHTNAMTAQCKGGPHARRRVCAALSTPKTVNIAAEYDQPLVTRVLCNSL